MILKFNRCFQRETKTETEVRCKNWHMERRGKNLKSCLEKKRSWEETREFRGGGEIIGTRESFSNNKLHSIRGRSLESVEDISPCRLNRMKRKQR